MGGGSYDRDVTTYDYSSAAAAADPGYSSAAAEALQEVKLHRDLDPRGKKLVCGAKTPIVVAIDVTGSMGDWAKTIWDKLPMFYGQLLLQDYCPEPQISFAGIGDSPMGDVAPLQVGEFAQSSMLDGVISKIYLEGLGGGNRRESYDLASYYYVSDNVSFTGAEGKPFFFISGDEGIYDKVDSEGVRKWVDEAAEGLEFPASAASGRQPVIATLPADLDPLVSRVQVELPDGSEHAFDVPAGAAPGSEVTVEVAMTGKSWSVEALFAQLCDKYHVFHLHKAYHSPTQEVEIKKQWASLIGEKRVLQIEQPKAVVDIMLGVIAVTLDQRDVDEYIEDMDSRGQDEERKASVKALLEQLPKEGEASAPGRPPVRAVKVKAAEGPKVVNEELGAKLVDFYKNGAPNSVMELPPTLNDWQKRSLHKWASKSGLKSVSFGEGAARHLTMTQPPVPMRFTDPITSMLMQDPVIGPDGYAYDRPNIEAWMKDHDISYITKAALPHKNLAPCEKLAEEILEWRMKHGI